VAAGIDDAIDPQGRAARMSKLMTRAQREAFFRRLRELNP
jgi:hypothetical protein